MQYEGKVALVTGASSGIGRAIAERLAGAGAIVHVNGRDRARVDTVVAACRERGGEAHAAVGDVTCAADMERLADTIASAHGALDILVNNAGATLVGYTWETSAADWERMLNVNLLGVANTTRAFVPAMIRAGRGAILNIGSVSGLVGVPMNGAYCAAKFALTGLSETLAAELGPHGIRVTLVCPGMVRTPIRDKVTFVGAADNPRTRRGLDRMFARSDLDADRVAQASLRAMRKGRRRAILGRDGRLLWLADRLRLGTIWRADRMPAPRALDARAGAISGSGAIGGNSE